MVSANSLGGARTIIGLLVHLDGQGVTSCDGTNQQSPSIVVKEETYA